MKIFIFLFHLCHFYSQVYSKKSGELELVFVNILYRHGDRTPTDTYPNDPYRDVSNWPVEWGQLTNLGKEQHYELGKWLRHRYHNFINESYKLSEIYVRSTDVDRTLMSAESNLAGLYPPSGKQIWRKNIPWQPIPIHTKAEHEDMVLAAKKHCLAYENEQARLKTSPIIESLNKKYSELYKYLTEHTGKTISSIEQVNGLYNTLFIENLYNKTLPEWTKSVFPDKIYEPATISFTLQSFTKKMQRLKSGPLLAEMIKTMKKKTKHKLSPDRKIHMFSAHDTTVANFLNTLGVFDLQCPPYRALILVELTRDHNKKYFVKVLYRNETDKDPYVLTIPSCTPLCPLSKFEELLEPVTPTNWEQECNLTYWAELDSDFHHFTFLVMIFVFFMVLIMVLVFVTLIVHWHKKSKHIYGYSRVSTQA